jgi:Cys-tRNA synthase (O-phospho-L-seryl-tRNA:Cys-tRNA synthase)
MGLLKDVRAAAARISFEEDHTICEYCGRGRLTLVDEAPDKNFGILGMLRQTLKCDAPDCGKLTIV